MECHRRLMELSRKVIKRVKHNICQQGFAWNQFKVMQNIQPGESLTLSEISARSSKKNSNITQIIDFLEEQGIVQRYPDDKDRRIIRVRLTDKGVQIREQVIKNHEEFIQNMYSFLDEREMQDFLRITDVLINKIQ